MDQFGTLGTYDLEGVYLRTCLDRYPILDPFRTGSEHLRDGIEMESYDILDVMIQHRIGGVQDGSKRGQKRGHTPNPPIRRP